MGTSLKQFRVIEEINETNHQRPKLKPSENDDGLQSQKVPSGCYINPDNFELR